MILITRFAAAVDVIRITFVYYRIVNTALFFRALAKGVTIMEILPLIIIAFLPTVWFVITVIFLEKELRRRAHKLLIGFCLNKIISYFISITIFTKVAKNLGSQGTSNFRSHCSSATKEKLFPHLDVALTQAFHSLGHVRSNSDLQYRAYRVDRAYIRHRDTTGSRRRSFQIGGSRI